MTQPPDRPGGTLPPPEEIIRRNRRRLRSMPVPVRWLILAAVTALAFTVCHALGLRENVSMVFGTGEHPSAAGALGGAAYATLYLATVIFCPILVIASGIRAVITWLVGREKPSA